MIEVITTDTWMNLYQQTNAVTQILESPGVDSLEAKLAAARVLFVASSRPDRMGRAVEDVAIRLYVELADDGLIDHFRKQFDNELWEELRAFLDGLAFVDAKALLEERGVGFAGLCGLVEVNFYLALNSVPGVRRLEPITVRELTDIKTILDATFLDRLTNPQEENRP